MNGMQLTYSMMPAISGDECLKKVAAKRQRQREPPKKEKEKKRVRKVDGDGIRSDQDDEPEVEGLVFTRNVIAEIQQIIDDVDSDEDDYIDREQFVDFLSEWGLDKKFTENELDELFKRLIDENDDDDEEEEEEEDDAESGGKASCNLFMNRLNDVHSDHPNYSARKAVYRVCRRLLKQTDTVGN